MLIEDIYEGEHAALRKVLVTSSCIVLLLSLALFIAGLSGFKLAYGRFSSESVITVCSASSRLAWFLFGIAVFPSALLALFGTSLDYGSVNFLLTFLILIHYVYRTFIYAYRIKGAKRVPLHLFALGFCNNFFEGFLQSTWHFMFVYYPSNWISGLHSCIGLMLFVLGMFIHIKSDWMLQGLRRRNEKSYKIPNGFLFDFVTAPNYLGECMEWIGFALLAWSLPSFAHACFVIAILVPRSLQYHRWYLAKFDDYPKDRKAIVPLVL